MRAVNNDLLSDVLGKKKSFQRDRQKAKGRSGAKYINV